MKLDSWSGETVVMDPDFYAVETPLLTDGIALCPCGTCSKQFETDNVAGFVQHVQGYHGCNLSLQRDCEYCGDTFTVSKNNRNQQYCSQRCAGKDQDRQRETTIDIANDIRQMVGSDRTDHHHLSRSELVAVRNQLQRDATATMQPMATDD